MEQNIAITGWGSISPLGGDLNTVWNKYLASEHSLIEQNFKKFKAVVGAIQESELKEVDNIRESNKNYPALDPTVMYAIYAARKAVAMAGWENDSNFGINIGSSRGATELFEKNFRFFELNDRGRTETLSSPTTTLGNISSWTAHDLGSKGPEISHSITCSTALHSILNGIAWLQSGMANRFLVGGSEAPLTAFTVAQMKALKIYADNGESEYPVRTLDLDKTINTMALGEGAALFCLESGAPKGALANIEGIGYATESLKHNISISANAICFQRSMRMAINDVAPCEVDVIVMHAPGTIKGDSSEFKAIQEVFGNDIPALTSNKWKIGHSLGSSGALSLELGVLMLLKQKYIPVPFTNGHKAPAQLKKILVNAVGFGGNAVSILISRFIPPKK